MGDAQYEYFRLKITEKQLNLTKILFLTKFGNIYCDTLFIYFYNESIIVLSISIYVCKTKVKLNYYI